MTHDEYVKYIAQVFADAVEIVKVKNKDYALENDPFRNFRNSTVAGVPIDKGILVRIMDKVTRMSHLLDKAPDVVDEKIDDTIKDCCNYLAILHTYLKYEKDTK